ncbi:hypothetical protein QR680_003279 [Steinernema hermaphroditum]|uniref:DUF7808 domain-containing protein n=1 Tax=Steinernema hermaphroditum TaxID=289476 RepID=A0AA39H708_9BILA|nr:hypothetical protein QR680_003279 [Steinernema hermaphroditum]
MAMPMFHYILVVFVAISAVLNAAVIIAILKFRKSNPYLKGSFFGLIIFHGVADLLLAFEFTTLMRARKYRYLDFMLYEGSALWYVLPYITNGLHYYLKAVIYMGNILLSFNRFTSAMFSLYYEPFWQSKIMISVRVLGWILPLAAVLPLVLNPNYHMWFSISESKETVRLQNDNESTQVTSYIDGSLSLAATVICFIFYALSAITISRQMLKHGMQKKHGVEIRLFISSFSIFIVLTLNSINQIWTIIASKQENNEIVMWLNDLSYPLLDVIIEKDRLELSWVLTMSTIELLLLSLSVLQLILTADGVQSSHNQMRVLTCIAEKEGDDAKCAIKLMKKPDAEDFESAPTGKGCFSEFAKEENTTKVFCPLYCPEASSAYIISKKPANNNKCIKFNNYQIIEKGGDYYFWRSGPCLKEELQFDIGCSFEFFEGMMDVKEFLTKKAKQ